MSISLCLSGVQLIPGPPMQTEYYRHFVFNGYRVRRGGFIEDKLGTIMLDKLRTEGPAAHTRFGTWLWDDACPGAMVGHLNGRGFLGDDSNRLGVPVPCHHASQASLNINKQRSLCQVRGHLAASTCFATR
jgi:hypothetical protein